MALFISVTFLSVYLIGRRSALHYIRPIVTMATVAESFGDVHWEADIEPSLINRKDEIGVLARSFESMRRQLQKLFKDLEYRVSELKLAQQSLKESESHFRGLFDGVPVGIYRTTFDGRIVDANPMLVRMLGYPSKEQFLSKKAEEIYARPVDRSKWKSIIESSGDKNVHEVKMRRYDQSVLWVENHSRTVRDKDQTILYVEGSIIDINERKKMEN
ncbi:PAS domain S-box protein [Desulfosarcina sp.]|uniref:PAS domain S-box protein n=1 Tax=Desulfosarcina sp. TaxID=2027861 RepID=UPI0029B65ADF|nr:PAS domain S-box protein [Desulfosarcina sp.]MDX2455751.1 PAS domain S-box protein [Desulfosarcina sp.]MDX2493220.1 PAS domain S-box protein [Desulfosarcina sp.]